MLATIRSLIWLVVLSSAVVAGAAWLPDLLRRVQVPADYDDLGGFTPFSGRWLKPPPFSTDDIVAFQYGRRAEDIGFGVVVALPGDQVRLDGDRLLVNGRAASGWKPPSPFPGLPAIGPLTIPQGHVYVLSDKHQHDSTVLGPIAPDQILGRVDG